MATKKKMLEAAAGSAGGGFEYVISANVANLVLDTAAAAAGWDGVIPLIVTIDAGVYVYSTSETVAAITSSQANAYVGGLTLNVNGVIMGRGGRGAYRPAASRAGGPALRLQSDVEISLGSNARICGGGGGGGYAYIEKSYRKGSRFIVANGGGGAGGGSNQYNVNYPPIGSTQGADGTVVGIAFGQGGFGGNNGGGGGGATNPTSDNNTTTDGGQGGVDPLGTNTGTQGQGGVYGGAAGGDGGYVGSNGANGVTGLGSVGVGQTAGGGGGGWGASGGSGNRRLPSTGTLSSTATAGAAGGPSVISDSYTITWSGEPTSGRVLGAIT
jgi:hypothetical protein